MKKYLMLLACLAAFPAGAEDLKFVTVLSQPVASFARVETLNAARPAQSLFVNFCNPSVASGSIDAAGLVKMNELRLTGDSRAGGDSRFTYQITGSNGLSLAQGGSLLGAKLLAKTANPQDVTVDAGVRIEAPSSFVGADLASLKIGTHTTVVPSSHSNNYLMAWKGDYTAAYQVTSADGVSAVPNSKYTSHVLRYRLGEEGVCGPNTPSEAQSKRERDCADDEKYGSGYIGTIKEKYKYLPDCVWEEISNDCRLGCSDSSYVAQHKSECCPDKPKTNTVCWTAKNEIKVDKSNPCICTPCAHAAMPSDDSIKLCNLANRCGCVKTWYTNGKGCTTSDWQYCETTYEKNGW